MIPRTHVFAIAIVNCQDAVFAPVTYAASDAAAFVQAWQELGVDSDNSVLLAGVQATLTAIRSRLRKFAGKVAAGDRVVLYFAGQGILIDGANRLIVHDTIADDIQETSLGLSDLLGQIQSSRCDEVLLFIDASQGKVATGDDSDADFEPFNAFELLEFCKAKSTHWAFVSCSPSEQSHPDHTAKSGIWNDCLVSALKGLGKNAVTKNGMVTVSSLHEFLAGEVPRRVRVAVAGAVTQSPQIHGDLKSKRVIAELNDLFHQRQLSVNQTVNFITESSLSGEKRGPVRGLSGYRKPGQPLSSHNQWERLFVESAGEAEVAKQADAIYTQIRESFRYKRKDTSFSKDGPVASIRTPDFDVNIALMQHPDQADQYLLRTEVVSIRSPEVVDAPDFLGIFTLYCDQVVFAMSGGLDIGAKIDEIEEVESLVNSIEYDSDCTEFTLRLPGTGIVIRATGDRIVFTLDRNGDLKTLLGKTRTALSHLATANITLGLPGGEG